MSGDWLCCAERRSQAELRLVCVPAAGAGPSAYRPWARHVGPSVEIWCAELPGRERRFNEPAATSMAEIAELLADAIATRLRPPVALFGHSMGALVASETARRLEQADPPVHLFVSGARAPHMPLPGAPHALDDDELREWLRRLDGAPQEVLADPQLLPLLLPLLRADLRVCDDYLGTPGLAPLSCPITALAGRDDPLATPRHVAAWSSYTTGEFDLAVFPGGHFYLQEREAEVTRLIQERLRQPAGSGARSPQGGECG